MFTYKFFVKPDSKKVQLRITRNRKKAEVGLGIEATAEELENALSDSPKTSNYYLASTLAGKIAKIKQIKMDFLNDGYNPDMSAREILDYILKNIFSEGAHPGVQPEEENKIDESKLFGKFYKKRMTAKDNQGYKASIEYTYKKMQAFCADKDSDHGKDFDELTFDDISLKWLNAFNEWLIKQGSAQNSRNIHFKNIRTVINRAIDDELTEKYPFRRFKIKQEETRKRSLKVEDLRKLFDYPVQEYQKFYLDMLKLEFYLIGINNADLYNLTEIRDGRIEYRRAKTHKLYSIKVEPEALEIIERWRGESKLLCIADRWSDPKEFTKNFNIALKKIGKWERIEGRGGKWKITPLFPDISSYWIRHSWATIAAELDVPDAVISQALGHSGNTNPVTAIYINRNRDKVDVANRKVIDYVLYCGKKKKDRPE